MEQAVEQTCYYDVRKKIPLRKYSFMKINHMNFSNLVIMLIKLYSPLGIDFVSFSNVFI